MPVINFPPTLSPHTTADPWAVVDREVFAPLGFALSVVTAAQLHPEGLAWTETALLRWLERLASACCV